MSERKWKRAGFVVGYDWTRWSFGICWRPGWLAIGIGPLLFRRAEY